MVAEVAMAEEEEEEERAGGGTEMVEVAMAEEEATEEAARVVANPQNVKEIGIAPIVAT